MEFVIIIIIINKINKRRRTVKEQCTVSQALPFSLFSSQFFCLYVTLSRINYNKQYTQCTRNLHLRIYLILFTSCTYYISIPFLITPPEIPNATPLHTSLAFRISSDTERCTRRSSGKQFARSQVPLAQKAEVPLHIWSLKTRRRRRRRQGGENKKAKGRRGHVEETRRR